MKVISVIAGSLCLLYFIGIAAYAGLSSLFPCIWAAGGVFFYGLSFLLHLHDRYHYFAGFSLPLFLKYIFGGIIAVGLICFLAVEGLIISGMFHEPSKNLDYIIVLGAQVNGRKLSNSLYLRAEKARVYLEDNPGTVAVLSGGQGSGEDISEAEAMYQFLLEKGISPERLLKEPCSTNTSENLKYSLEIIERRETGQGKKAAIGVVTNNFHVYRGVSLGKKLGCTAIEGVPAGSNAFLQVNYMVREFFGIVKDKAVGNM